MPNHQQIEDAAWRAGYEAGAQDHHEGCSRRLVEEAVRAETRTRRTEEMVDALAEAGDRLAALLAAWDPGGGFTAEDAALWRWRILRPRRDVPTARDADGRLPVVEGDGARRCSNAWQGIHPDPLRPRFFPTCERPHEHDGWHAYYSAGGHFEWPDEFGMPT